MNLHKIVWRIALSVLLQVMVAEVYAEEGATSAATGAPSASPSAAPTTIATPTAIPAQVRGGASTTLSLPGASGNSPTATAKGQAGAQTSPATTLQDALKPGASAVAAETALNPDQNNPIPESQYKSEFQDFVAQSVGSALPLFGYNLFRNAPNTFAPLNNVPVTQDYVIGPGDELIISVWGQVEVSQSVEVDRNGMINLPKIGPVSVVGVRYQNLQSHLKVAVSKIYRNFELDVTLGKLRSIQIFVVGQAARPGSYTVSSLSTLVNALFASGGPSAIGSMRHIQLKRGEKIVTEFDMYDLLLRGDKSKDVQLLPGDVIFIPTIGALAAISGSVNKPAIFELKNNETLATLLNLAGGLTNVASGKKVEVERIHEHAIRKVDEFLLDTAGLLKPIHDGDVVLVNPISVRFDNAVKLQGNVAMPMRYIWKQDMRVADLLAGSNALVPTAYWARQNSGAINSRYNKKEVNWDYAVLQRFDQDNLTTHLVAFNLGKAIKGDPLDNMLLQPGDVVTIFSAEDALPKTENDVMLKGSIFTPSDRRFVWREGMHVRDLVPSAQALIETYDYWQNAKTGSLSSGINWGYASVVRLQATDLSRNMLSIDLGKALIESDQANNIALLPGDELTIYTNDEMQVPAEKRNRFVRLEGEVLHPGLYQVQAGETLRQLVQRVGGISTHAYLFGSEFSRESTRKVQQARLEEIIARMEADVQRNAMQSATAGLSKDDAELSRLQAQSQQSLVAKMRQVKATGRIVLELPSEAVALNNLPELTLEDGDRFFIPIAPSTVSVMGTVYNQNAFIYRKGQNVGDYLEKSGGPTRDGDKDDVYLIRADGQVISKRQSSYAFGYGGFSGRTAMPGDVVVVPEKLDKYNFTKDLKDWTQIFYQFAFGVAAFKSIGVF